MTSLPPSSYPTAFRTTLAMDPGPSERPPALPESEALHGKPRRRLAPDGYALLTDQYKLTPNLTEQHLRELLQRLHEIHGCDWYTFEDLKRYWRGLRQKMVPKEVPASTHDILHPSLTPESILKLQVLLSENPSPRNVEVGIWARRLGATHIDVQTWIDLWKSHLPESSNKKHLPTPDPSTSPEPTHATLPPFYATGMSNAVSQDSHEMPKMSPHQEKQFPSLAEVQELGLALKHVLSEENPSPVARTPQEFCMWMDSHNHRLQNFLNNIKNGEYAQLGWDPSFAGDVLSSADGKSLKEE
ncbi:hypothetical protein BKA93DRAFT_531916 [Sparassis latifolia]|uniref:Uncharacterized protein n=1 Tax=Sparassis crispa TaxID=139825 RepID=A0A401H744_9APHY|nr:hypothetical protein SCP_1400020 [Sparassis crispa]XP_027621181.1 hypothetical protein SCP_2000110 [Sparassis crispa]GBE88598.1 hypothetical protein SCP_1400020 [Sparassis crispa]GBE90268.1 hypothetical protein SCP_2000110 [Sparassis crispa]